MVVRPLILFVLCLCSTFEVEAAVSINEVAWMGDSTTANHEWIELVNDDTESVSVEGWTLSDGMNLNISLVGTIAGGAYAVLERTSEESAVGQAFLLYTGAMVNTGATLVLTDAVGSIVDQVTGGTDWQNIGGDNTTKETAQYSTRGWVTGVPTPGAVNGAGHIDLPSEDTHEEDTTLSATTPAASQRSSRGSGAAIALPHPSVPLKILPEVQSVAYVHQRIPLRASVSGLSKSTQPLVRFEWNFGDTHYATGTEVWHTYEYPGSYAITTFARYGTDEQMAQQQITVLPVDVSLTYGQDGEVQLHNDAPYDIDISGYVLRGQKEVVFPLRSILLTRATITVDAKRVGTSIHELVALYDTKKNLVTSTYQKDTSTPVATVNTPASVVQADLTPVIAEAPTTAFTFTTPLAEASSLPGEEQKVKEIIQILPDSKESRIPTAGVEWPYYALIMVLLLVTGTLVAWKGVPETVATDDSN